MKRVALVTGGAQGIGAAAAKALLTGGFTSVVLVDRNGEKLEKQAVELAQFGEVRAIALDLAEDITPGVIVKLSMSTFGRIDALVNAAGNTERCGIEDTTPEAFHRIFDVNVKAPLFMMQAVAKVMKQQKQGTIINIASMLAHGGPPLLATYSASKGALVALTRNAANTFKRDGIRVFGINLGWVNSDAEHALQTGFHKQPQDWADHIGGRMPSGRLQKPEDVAGLIHYLTTPSAQMMTGAIIDYEQMPIGVYDDHPALKQV